jgi:hypothetical protein
MTTKLAAAAATTQSILRTRDLLWTRQAQRRRREPAFPTSRVGERRGARRTAARLRG